MGEWESVAECGRVWESVWGGGVGGRKCDSLGEAGGLGGWKGGRGGEGDSERGKGGDSERGRGGVGGGSGLRFRLALRNAA